MSCPKGRTSQKKNFRKAIDKTEHGWYTNNRSLERVTNAPKQQQIAVNFFENEPNKKSRAESKAQELS